MKNLIGAVAIVVVCLPWLMKSLDDGSININRLVINLVSTVQEIVTRQPAQWRAPAPEQRPPQQEPPNQL